MRPLSLKGNPQADPETTRVPRLDSQPLEPPCFAPLPAPKARRSAGFGCSVLGHIAAIAAMMFGVSPGQEPPLRPLAKYSVRYLQLRAPDPPARPSGGGPASAPAAPGNSVRPATKGLPKPPDSGTPGIPPGTQAHKAEPRKFELPKLPQAKKVEQTLVQLESPPDLAMRAEIRVPAAILWDARTVNLPRPAARKFIAPERKNTPRVSQTVLPQPTLEVPNKERNLADINMAAVRSTDVPLLPQPPSSTTPIRITGPAPSGEIPRSAAAESAEREAANLISIPDFPMPASTVLAIPPANQVAAAHMGTGGDQGTGSAGSSGNGAAGENGPGNGQGQRLGAGAGAGSPSGATGGDGAGVSQPGMRGSGQGTLASGAGTAAGKDGRAGGTGTGTGPGRGAGSGEGSNGGAGGPVARIVRPQDGRFPAIVLGSAVSGQYPESVGVLGGRLVYTVYVRVGTKKSWIMQYSLPRSAEQAVKVKGSATPVDPPYPFLILRPQLEFAPDMDYVIVHGVVTAAGKFEQLAIVGITDFPQERLLLSSLSLWQFRPASRDGQPTSVEVLLIIPREEV